MKYKTILVTGATGFLGFNIIKELLNTEYKIKAFVENGKGTIILDQFDIEIKHGDIQILEDVQNALDGCDIVIHTAALTDIWPKRSSHVWNVNYTGTKNLVVAAKKAGIEKFIHIGSASSFGFGTKNNPGNENVPYKNGKYKLDYMESKKRAQDLVLSEVKENNFPAIVVNPTFMFGSYSANSGSSNDMILAQFNNKIPGYTNGGRNFIHVKDVAVGIINAIAMGRIGECYIMGNENLTFKEIFLKISNLTKTKPPAYKFPDYLAKSFGFFLSVLSRILKKKPSISYTMAKISCDEHYFSSKKAIEELNLPQTPIEYAIKDALNWFEESNIVK